MDEKVFSLAVRAGGQDDARGMPVFFLLILLTFFAFSQDPILAQSPVLPRGPTVVVINQNNQYPYGYDGYYYGGVYYGYGGGYAARGRDWNNYSDGRYESRGNHRAADRARGGGGGGRR